MLRLLSLLFVASFAVSVAFAQKPPELGYIFPPVVSAGTETHVQLGGYDFTPDMQYFVHDDRVALTVLDAPGEIIVPPPPYWFGERSRSGAFPLPREVPAVLHVPADQPQGVVRWQVANANGSSATAVVGISHGPEILEERDRSHPQVISQLPVGVSGRLEKIAEVDQYLITAERSGPVSIELFARRLGSDFNGVLSVRDADDRVIADTADTQGLDTSLTFAAKANATYTIRLHDLDYRGNRAYVYRLALTAGPRVVAVNPSVLRPGTTEQVEFVGFGVATGAAHLESVKRNVDVPADSGLASHWYQLETPHGTAVPLEIPLDRLGSTAAPTETETPVISIPGVYTRQMPGPGQEAFQFTAKAKEVWSISAQSRAIGTSLDLALEVLGTDSNSLGSNDDFAGSPDAGLDFTAPADGDYRIVVRDLSGQPLNKASLYRLSVIKSKPNFELVLPQQISLATDTKSEVTVQVKRHGGFEGEVALSVTGLPDAVNAPDNLLVASDQSELKLSLEADADAAVTSTLLMVTGQSTIENTTITRTATCEAAGNLCPQLPRETQTNRCLLSMTMKPLFTVEVVDRNRQRAVHRGTTYPAPFRITRKDNFNGEVSLSMAARQSRHRQGIFGPTMTVAGDSDSALYPCFMPEWLETDRTTRMVVLGAAQQADPQGNLRYITQPANARVTMILEGALLKVSHSAPELTIVPGRDFEIPVAVSRSSKLQIPVSVEVVAPPTIRRLLNSETVTLLPQQTRGVVRVRTLDDRALHGRWKLLVKATAMLDKRWPVVSQTEVTLDFTESGEKIAATQ